MATTVTDPPTNTPPGEHLRARVVGGSAIMLLGSIFVGGMNLKGADWDTSRHEVYDEQRMALGAFDLTRELVAAKNRHPDNGPRKDYMVRVEGPAALEIQHLSAVILERVKSQYIIPEFARIDIRPASVQRPSLFGTIPIALQNYF
jgi:hypothetical protein